MICAYRENYLYKKEWNIKKVLFFFGKINFGLIFFIIRLGLPLRFVFFIIGFDRALKNFFLWWNDFYLAIYTSFEIKITMRAIGGMKVEEPPKMQDI